MQNFEYQLFILQESKLKGQCCYITKKGPKIGPLSIDRTIIIHVLQPFAFENGFRPYQLF